VYEASAKMESTASKTQSETEERGEEMLVRMPAELLDGLLSGLEAQSSMTQLLEALNYEGLG
jgi:hypothetical protein